MLPFGWIIARKWSAGSPTQYADLVPTLRDDVRMVADGVWGTTQRSSSSIVPRIFQVRWEVGALPAASKERMITSASARSCIPPCCCRIRLADRDVFFSPDTLFDFLLLTNCPRQPRAPPVKRSRLGNLAAQRRRLNAVYVVFDDVPQEDVCGRDSVLTKHVEITQEGGTERCYDRSEVQCCLSLRYVCCWVTTDLQ